MGVPQWWLDDPEGGKHEWWQRVRESLVSHDQTCASLRDCWLPRKGGVSCPSDLFWCEGCDICIFIEGVYGYPDWYCECCNRGRVE